MSFNEPLDSGQYESLRGSSVIAPTHQGMVCLSLCPNDNVFTARVNQSAFSASFAKATYDGASGTLGDIRPGMTLLVSHTNDRRAAFFTGRIRLAPSSVDIFFNETSAPFADNDYIFVIQDYRIWDTLAREVGSTEYPDYDRAFRQLLPRITNLKSAYAGKAVSGILTLSFAPVAAAATDGASISSYLWDVDDGTITVGSATTNNITATFPPGFRFIHFTVTDSGGRPLTRHVAVWSHDATYPVTLLDHGDLSVTGTIDDGFSGTVSAFAGIDALLDNTLVCAWLDESYNGTPGPIFDNVVLLGRLRRETDTGPQTDFEIEGPLQQLARLEITSQELDNKLSATAFNQVKTLTVWREIQLIMTEYSTYSELHSLGFDSTADTFREQGVVNQAENLLGVANGLGNGITAGMECDASGESQVVRNGVLIPTGDRGALATVADWEAMDILADENGYLQISLTHDHVQTVGKLDASGGTFSDAANRVTRALSVAPGIAQKYPDGTAQLNNQILAANQSLAQAEAELNIRAGHALAKEQGGDELTVQHPDGYWWLTPSRNQWYTFTLDGSETARGIVLDTSIRWQLISVSITHEVETGTRTVEAVYRRETSGAPGQAWRYPAQTASPLTLPKFPAFPAFPAFDIGAFYLPDDLSEFTPPATLAGSMGTLIKHDGNTFLRASATHVYIANDFVNRYEPTWIDVTPVLEPGETIVDAHLIPGSPVGVLLETNLATPFTVEYDFAESPHGWLLPPSPPNGSVSHWLSGSGWHSGPITVGPFYDDDYIYINTGGVTGGTLIYDVDNTLLSNSLDDTLRNYAGPDLTGGVLDSQSDSAPIGTSFTNRSFIFTFASLGRSVLIAVGGVDGALFRKITLNYEGGARVWRMTNVGDTSTWAAGGTVETACNLMRIGDTYAEVSIWDPVNAKAYYSSNYGASFEAAVVAGTPAADLAGFDTARLGPVTIAGTDGKMRIATAAGGAYSDYTPHLTDAIASAIFIPRYKFVGGNNGSGVSAPDYWTASDVADVAGHSVWTVTTGGTVFTNITPVDGGGAHGYAVGPNCLHTPWYSTAHQDMLAILNFAGTRKLAVSVDGGATWVFSGALDASAAIVKTRRSDTGRRQLFIANGKDLAYCSSYRTNPPVLATRIGPDADTTIAIDILP